MNVWNYIVNLPTWPRLSDIPFNVTTIADRILVGDDGNTFLVAVPYDSSLHPAASGVLFVNTFICASDITAVRRIVLLEIEGDLGCRLNSVPSALWPEGVVSYEELRKTLLGPGVEEFAKYRVASDGAFICRVLRHDAREFYFRQRGDGSELFFSVSFSLPCRSGAG